MSRIMSIFFSPTNALHSSKDEIGEHLNCNFVAEHFDDFVNYRAQCIGMDLLLIENHNIVNDLGIDFEAYSCELDISVDPIPDAELAEHFQLYAAKYIFSMIRYNLKWKSILVANFQKQLASFAGD